jgi:serine-type D-Ala-D-Ala carboxypeptidase/endopeptidase (penicillin-binding protein 4)
VTLAKAFVLVLLLMPAACEGSPTLPPQVQAVGRPTPPDGSPRTTPCPEPSRTHRGGRPYRAAWKRRLDRLAAGHSVGIAVGVKGTVVYQHGARLKRTPASNEKLLLSMALFDHFGPDFRITTTAAARRIRQGTVPGDLWILGAGDPSLTQKEAHFWGDLSSPTLKLLADRIKAAGILRVAGTLRGDTSYFSHDFDAPGWQPFVPRNYVELPAALSVNGNFHVHGRPELGAARNLDKQLGALGIEAGGPPGTGKPPKALSQIAAVRSSPLSQIVAFMDETSNNFFAEMLGKLLGADVYGPPGTIREGARAITTWARRYGVRVEAYDSSGLSYRDKVSPIGIVRLLAAAETRPWGATLRSDLPAPGQGTLRGRLSGLDVHAKTGSLFNSDSALSGWVRSNNGDGPWVEFSILDQEMPKTVEDQMVTTIARAPGASFEPFPRRSAICR